jgi:hypothetical protein
LSCDTLCPDLDDFPVTFCTNGLDVGISDAGYCLSRCDPRFVENGGSACRDGYTCKLLARNAVPDFKTGVCAPGEPAAPTDCRRGLESRDVLFTPVAFTAEHPEGYPELTCDIEDPVFLYSPLGDTALIDIRRGESAPALASCSLVNAIESMLDVARSMGAREIFIVNPYSCRLIVGGAELSMHGLGEAIDIFGFRLDDDSVLTVAGDWEDGVEAPVTPAGAWLRQFTDTLWERQIFSVILTPEYDDAHDDHFHLDLTPATVFYQ